MVTAWPVQVSKQDFGEWLKDEMYSRGWGPSDFAKMVGVGHGSVGNWINRGGVPYPKTCYRIAEVLGIPPADVLERAGHVVDNPTPEPAPTRPRISAYVPEGGIDPELIPEILDFAMRKQAELLERRRKDAEAAAKGDG